MLDIINNLLSVFNNVPTVLASLGLILATSSFISGLQLVKSASVVEGKIHRFNGFTTIILFLALFLLSMIRNGFSFGLFFSWAAGFSVILLKLWIVRGRKRRAFKYVSWLGGTLILLWLFIVYIHIPV